MATYASDDEQIEAIKRWWRENGNSLMISVAIILVSFFGYRQWQSNQLASAEAASDLYQQIADMVVSAPSTAGLTGEEITLAQENYGRLHAEFENSIYTRYSALLMAGIHAAREEYEQSARELNWILDNPELGILKRVDEELLLTARLRLARIRIQQGEAQQALDLLTAVDPGGLLAGFAETEGDAWLRLGQTGQARAAYERAMAAAPANANLLQLKLQSVSVVL